MDNPNFVTIAPTIPESVDHATAQYNGLKVLWKKCEGALEVHVHIPENMEGNLVFGNKTIPLQKGENKIKL